MVSLVLGLLALLLVLMSFNYKHSFGAFGAALICVLHAVFIDKYLLFSLGGFIICIGIALVIDHNNRHDVVS